MAETEQLRQRVHELDAELEDADGQVASLHADSRFYQRRITELETETDELRRRLADATEHRDALEAELGRTLAHPAEQPPPVPTTGPAIWDLVLEDLGALDGGISDVVDLVKADARARDATGLRRYGTRLQAHNGRDALRDAYEEQLDGTVYLRQAVEEHPANEALRALYLSARALCFRLRAALYERDGR